MGVTFLETHLYPCKILGNLLGNINESIKKGEKEFERIKMTRWTVRAECMETIIANY